MREILCAEQIEEERVYRAKRKLVETLLNQVEASQKLKVIKKRI